MCPINFVKMVCTMKDLSKFSGGMVPSVKNGMVSVRGWDPVELKVYDAAHLTKFEKLKSVSITGMPHALNLDTLEKVGPLESLALEVFKLDPINILECIDPSELRFLWLSNTAPSKLDLGVLTRFPKLQELTISGQRKNLEAVGQLETLKRLTIGLVAKSGCGFLSGLKRLEVLQLLLGGQEDISNIQCPSLKELEVVRVCGLNELGDLSRFPKLESLRVENQPRLTCLRASRPMQKLADVTVFSCPNITRFEGGGNLPKLRDYKSDDTPLFLPIA
jgi:hypothetical protein